MARYKKVETKIWGDAKFQRLSPPPPNAQTLWFRLLTGPETNQIPGLIPVGEAALAEALRWDLEGFREAFREVSAEGMAEADWEARLIWLPNAYRYNAPESPNVVRHWGKVWEEIPESPLKVKAYQQLRAYCEGLGEAFAKAFREALAEPFAESRARAVSRARAEETERSARATPEPTAEVEAPPVVAEEQSGGLRPPAGRASASLCLFEEATEQGLKEPLPEMASSASVIAFRPQPAPSPLPDAQKPARKAKSGERAELLAVPVPEKLREVAGFVEVWERRLRELRREKLPTPDGLKDQLKCAEEILRLHGAEQLVAAVDYARKEGWRGLKMHFFDDFFNPRGRGFSSGQTRRPNSLAAGLQPNALEKLQRRAAQCEAEALELAASMAASEIPTPKEDPWIALTT
jgi:hypothetical protein